MNTFLVESILQGYHKYKDNWLEGSNFALVSAEGQRYFKIDICAPEFTPQVSTHAHVNFLSGSREFYKNGGKFGWIKYWQMTFNSPNSPKFSPATILRYTVYRKHYLKY